MIKIRRRISTPFSAQRYAVTVAAPEVDAIKVPSVRTIVIFPGAVRAEKAEHLAKTTSR